MKPITYLHYSNNTFKLCPSRMGLRDGEALPRRKKMKEIQYKPVVHKGEKRIAVIFKYDSKLITALRKKTAAKWSKTMCAWHIADTAEHRIKCGLALEGEETSQKIIAQALIIIPEKTVIKEVSSETKEQFAGLPILILKPIQTRDKEEKIGIFFKTNKNIEIIIRQIAGVKYCTVNQCLHLPFTKISVKSLQTAFENIATIQYDALSLYLRKRKLNNDINKKAGYKSDTSFEQIFEISTHNLQLLNRCIEQLHLKAYSTSTIRTYKNEMSIFLQTLKNKHADTLTTEDIRQYIHFCINNLKLSENTVHSRLNALKFMYEQVLGHEKFFVEIPRPKKHLQLPKVLGEEELRRLFNAPKNLKHKAILFVAYSAGLRVSEVINLRLQDIDRERKQLFIHCSKGKKDRYVMLSPLVLDVLEQYYKMSEVKPVNYLFEGQEKGKPYSIRSAQQIFHEAKKTAGIIKSLSFHSLRHSFATHLLEKGVDVIFIKDLLGHFDIKTTERYLHIKRDLLINIESPIDKLYAKHPGDREK